MFGMDKKDMVIGSVAVVGTGLGIYNTICGIVNHRKKIPASVKQLENSAIALCGRIERLEGAVFPAVIVAPQQLQQVPVAPVAEQPAQVQTPTEPAPAAPAPVPGYTPEQIAAMLGNLPAESLAALVQAAQKVPATESTPSPVAPPPVPPQPETNNGNKKK